MSLSQNCFSIQSLALLHDLTFETYLCHLIWSPPYVTVTLTDFMWDTIFVFFTFFDYSTNIQSLYDYSIDLPWMWFFPRHPHICSNVFIFTKTGDLLFLSPELYAFHTLHKFSDFSNTTKFLVLHWLFMLRSETFLYSTHELLLLLYRAVHPTLSLVAMLLFGSFIFMRNSCLFGCTQLSNPCNFTVIIPQILRSGLLHNIYRPQKGPAVHLFQRCKATDDWMSPFRLDWYCKCLPLQGPMKSCQAAKHTTSWYTCERFQQYWTCTLRARRFKKSSCPYILIKSSANFDYQLKVQLPLVESLLNNSVSSVNNICHLCLDEYEVVNALESSPIAS